MQASNFPKGSQTMDANKTPYWWSLPIGFVYPVLQIFIFVFRFKKLNTLGSPWDYLLFFVAGFAGALLLIFFLHRSRTKAGRWIILGAYLLAVPLALAGMIAGGVLGPVGIILFSFMPWALFMWLGYLAGAFLPA
jgi:hypothetical protein